MARKQRVHYPAALYHVIIRGNARQEIFFDDVDRSRFYLLIQEGLERYEHRIHAFCLMTNHIHLAIQVGDMPLSRIMQNISFRYTQWINWWYKRSGHLFQGRFKAVLVKRGRDEEGTGRSSHIHFPHLAGSAGAQRDVHYFFTSDRIGRRQPN